MAQKAPNSFGTFAGSQELRSLETVPDEGIYGLGVFATRFFQYLLRYSDFEEFHFFNLGLPSHQYEPKLLRADGRVKIRPLHEFTQAVDEVNFVALHNPWGPDIGPWVDLRNRLSNKPIPVTGLTHTISYQSFLPRTLLTMVLETKPWDSIVCTSQSAVVALRNWIEYLRGRFSDRLDANFEARLDTIPLAVDTEIFCPREPGPLRQRFELPQDHVVVLYVGRFSPYDKMDLAPLLLAFRQAAKSKVPCTLVLAGADSRFQYAGCVLEIARDLGIADSVRVLRDLADADVPRLFAAADVFVSPSDNLQETFGQTVIEAMASALPVVCSDWNGYRDLVVHERTGYLIPTSWQACDSRVGDYAAMWEPAVAHFFLSQTVSVDVDSMAAALSRLIANPDLRERLGGAGRRRVLELYDWRVVIRSYMNLWEELHSIATQEGSVTRISSWYRPEFFSTFKHYASSIMEPAMLVRATSFDDVIPWRHNLNSWLRRELITVIREYAVEPLSVGELEQFVCGSSGISAEAFRFHLLWMLKYHVLQGV